MLNMSIYLFKFRLSVVRRAVLHCSFNTVMLPLTVAYDAIADDSLMQV